MIFKPPPVRALTPDDNPLVRAALNEIYGTYGARVSVANKAKSLLKFGRNDSVGTSYALVWMNTTQASETLASTNAIDRVSSSNAGDTQAIKIEGHTISGSDLTFSVQSATLNGQNKVTLTTPLARATRLYNDGATDFAGSVWVYEDTAIVAGVPTDKAKAHLLATGGAAKNQSEKCATSLSSADYMIVTQIYGSVLSKTSATVEFDFQVKLSGKVWRTRLDFSADNDSGLSRFDLGPYFIVPPNSDLRIRAKSSAANTEVEAGFHGYLAF